MENGEPQTESLGIQESALGTLLRELVGWGWSIPARLCQWLGPTQEGLGFCLKNAPADLRGAAA